MGSDLYKLTLCLICVWFVVSDGSSAKASSGLRVDMAKVRRPRIRGLINSDLYILIFGLMCGCRW
jgi:hypothetical protein